MQRWTRKKLVSKTSEVYSNSYLAQNINLSNFSVRSWQACLSSLFKAGFVSEFSMGLSMPAKFLFWFWQFLLGISITSQEITQLGTNFNELTRMSLTVANACLFPLLLPSPFSPDTIGPWGAKCSSPWKILRSPHIRKCLLIVLWILSWDLMHLPLVVYSVNSINLRKASR